MAAPAGVDAPWFAFVLAALATWRVAHLLAHEDGPWDAVLRLRAALGGAGHVLDCFYCLSLWIAAPLAVFVARNPLEWLIAWLGLSGAACLLERLGTPRPGADTNLRGEDDVLLWTEAPGAGGDHHEQRAAPADARGSDATGESRR